MYQANSGKTEKGEQKQWNLSKLKGRWLINSIVFIYVTGCGKNIQALMGAKWMASILNKERT